MALARAKSALLGLSLGLALIVAAPVTASTQPVDTVLDVDFSLLDFSAPVRLTAGADALADGQAYLYDDIITIDGVDVDATVTIEARNDCRLGTFDD